MNHDKRSKCDDQWSARHTASLATPPHPWKTELAGEGNEKWDQPHVISIILSHEQGNTDIAKRTPNHLSQLQTVLL